MSNPQGPRSVGTLKTLQANFSPIFGLFKDKQKELESYTEAIKRNRSRLSLLRLTMDSSTWFGLLPVPL